MQILPVMENNNYYGQRQYHVTVKERPTLSFKSITLADMPLINQLLQHSSTRTCDYTAGGIYMWIDCFGYEYCVFDDTLFIKGFSENRPGEVAFSLPIGKMPLQESVSLLRQYCDSMEMPLVFSAIPEDRVDAVAAITGGSVEQLDGWSDYLYEAVALASLSGKAKPRKPLHGRQPGLRVRADYSRPAAGTDSLLRRPTDARQTRHLDGSLRAARMYASA